jgi:hypothetical protein
MGRRARLVIGVVGVVVGGFATIAGLGVVLLVGPDGSIGIPATRLLSSGYAVTLPQLDVPRLPAHQELVLDVTVASPGTPTFLGVGPSPAVAAYLRGAPIDVIAQIDWPGAARTTHVDGHRQPSPPGAQPFWAIADEGDAPSLHWVATPGDWTLVVMTAEATQPVDVTAGGSITISALGPLGFVALGVALAILGAGIWITVRAARAVS